MPPKSGPATHALWSSVGAYLLCCCVAACIVRCAAADTLRGSITTYVLRSSVAASALCCIMATLRCSLEARAVCTTVAACGLWSLEAIVVHKVAAAMATCQPCNNRCGLAVTSGCRPAAAPHKETWEDTADKNESGQWKNIFFKDHVPRSVTRRLHVVPAVGHALVQMALRLVVCCVALRGACVSWLNGSPGVKVPDEGQDRSRNNMGAFQLTATPSNSFIRARDVIRVQKRMNVALARDKSKLGITFSAASMGIGQDDKSRLQHKAAKHTGTQQKKHGAAAKQQLDCTEW
mmetsp:Transcript_62638/g.123823  ORF Transcript_62638/g.123823 Transcript_62638/m.123823 type:complete len:291 (+) Transcript_62638:209-1081(+)|eukprot:CAMPEP_0172913554 /NCGR_PEP_ID=MMETSP1075-20121228/190602_1 /TAXON_ID=2916 /ORGANISM="Ceratium fusus, Strain PA161109" /LENGTH=290 /DNA_ID=CAMNT_0013772289 /DNA_START=205 /DNA_END=1077 /DNA_ORIENTATION=-